MRRTKTSYNKARLRELLWMLIQKHQPNCHFCGEPFLLEVDLPASRTDELTEHHVDGNHFNSALGNRVLAHRSCHKRYHTKDNVGFWNQFKEE